MTATCKNETPKKKVPTKQGEFAKHPNCPEWQREEKWRLDQYRKVMVKS
jgi:hypothetical protein